MEISKDECKNLCNTLKEFQELLDETTTKSLDEGTYLEFCNKLKDSFITLENLPAIQAIVRKAKCKDRKYNYLTLKDKWEQVEKGNKSYIVCKNCMTPLQKYSLKEHQKSNTCRDKANLRKHSVISKQFVEKKGADLSILKCGDLLERLCIDKRIEVIRRKEELEEVNSPTHRNFGSELNLLPSS